jgi:hypothetical protein
MPLVQRQQDQVLGLALERYDRGAAALADDALHGWAEGLLEHADGDVVLGGGDEGECLHESVYVFAVFEIAWRWWQGRRNGGRGVDLGDAVQTREVVHVGVGGRGGGEEDEVVALGFEGVGIAAGDDWRGRLDLTVEL